MRLKPYRETVIQHCEKVLDELRQATGSETLTMQSAMELAVTNPRLLGKVEALGLLSLDLMLLEMEDAERPRTRVTRRGA